MGHNRLGTLRLIALLQHFRWGRWGAAAQTVVRRVILEKKKKVVKRKLLVKTNARNHRSYLY